MTEPDHQPAPGVPAEEASMAFPSQYNEDGSTSWDRVEMDLRGDELKITCEVPSIGKVEVRCFMGHDVTYAKGQLSRATDIPHQNIKFFYEDKLMFDPLSFFDFPSIVASTTKEISVRVEVDPPVS